MESDSNSKNKMSYIDGTQIPFNILSILDQIPDSNGSRYYKKMDLKIGIVTDKSMYYFYKDAANFYYINTTNYKEIIDNNELDLFMFVTCWSGLDEEWKNLTSSQHKKNKLYKIIDYIKNKNIPTIFQSIEAPGHYQDFIDIAQKFDFIFTSTLEEVEQYKEDCNNQNVWVLEFGINPYLHNPIGINKYRIKNAILFDDSWMSDDEERCKDMKRIFDGVLESGYSLSIVDEIILNGSEHIYPQLEYTTLKKLLKVFNWSINLNSIKNSETMCSKKVFELQALGSNILSNNSRALNNRFLNIFIIHNKDEINPILTSFNEEETYRHQLRGVRNVFTGNTVFDRLYFILNKIGIDSDHPIPKVLVLSDSKDLEILDMFNNQTYPNKELELINNVTLEQYNEADIITFFNSAMRYHEYYLEDMINGFKYTDSDYITKDCYIYENKLVEGVEHDYVSMIKNKDATLFWREAFSLNYVLTLENNTCREKGYSIDRFEMNEVCNDECGISNENYKLSVIVPIFNNGIHLLNRCFNSLKRSSMFNDMEIILVDDASTDQITPLIIKRLNSKYSNIKTFFYNDKPSGSASRPRNKGIELATAPYLTFLDPDNEAIYDGYSKLYQETTDQELDIIMGKVQISNTERVLVYAEEGIIQNPREFHINHKRFSVNSIQALIVKKNLIIHNDLRMVLGAAGQDSLFFTELMLNAKKVKCINNKIHIYYVHVNNSMVNSINKTYFEKKLLLEKEAIKRYAIYDVLSEYKKIRFEKWIRNWYLLQLRKVDIGDAKASIDIIYDIYKIYSKDLTLNDPIVKEFIKLCEESDYQTIINRYILRYSKK